MKAGQHAQALERVNRVLATKPRDPQARFLKGLIFAEQGNHKEALEIFLKLTQDYPQLPEPYNNLAVLYAAQGQYDKARAALEQSIRTHPTYATAYENLGDVYAKLASQAYDKALQLDSSNAAARNKLALVRELVGPPARAVATAAAPTKTPAPAVAPTPASAPAPAEAKPPAAAAAAPSPAAEPKAAEAGTAAQVLETVNAWARAWSAKDADAYLGFYAPGFRTPTGEPREQWEKMRRQRIAAPKSITVTVGSPKVTLHGDDRASVTFRQTYRSDLVNATSTKTLVLVKSNGRWMIQEERVVN
ncbi:MAG: tetratricopeptide repeat protein [Burkholderiales bacterium]|nr:tetratricopeptide repeat protein [Burkholderiales bacterium]